MKKDFPTCWETIPKSLTDDKVTIGIPRSLMLFYQEFPFWNTFFRELGFRVLLSAPSDQKLVKNSIEVMVSETCLPVELAHGHVLDLLRKNADLHLYAFHREYERQRR